MDTLLDQIIQGDCIDWLPKIPPESVHLFLSDIPYGKDWTIGMFYTITQILLISVSPRRNMAKVASKEGENRFGAGMPPTETLSEIIKNGVTNGRNSFTLL